MNRPDAEAEPSMEDILASIRKIIAEEPAQALAIPVPSAPASTPAPRQSGAAPDAPDSLSARLQDVFGTGARLDTLRSPVGLPPRPATPVPTSRGMVQDDIDDLLADAPKLLLPSLGGRAGSTAAGQPVEQRPASGPPPAVSAAPDAPPLAMPASRPRLSEQAAIPAPMMPRGQPPTPSAPPPLSQLIVPVRAEAVAAPVSSALNAPETEAPVPEPKSAPVVIASMRPTFISQQPTPVSAASAPADPARPLAGHTTVDGAAAAARPVVEDAGASQASPSNSAAPASSATGPVVIAAMQARAVVQGIARAESASAAQTKTAQPLAPPTAIASPVLAATPAFVSPPPLAALAIGLDTSGRANAAPPINSAQDPASDAVASALGALAAGLAASARPAATVAPEIVVAAPPQAAASPDLVPDGSGDPQSGSREPATADRAVTILTSPGISANGSALESSAGFEDKAAELLRPMLRQWLDDNMPRIVEKALLIELSESGALDTAVTARDDASKG